MHTSLGFLSLVEYVHGFSELDQMKTLTERCCSGGFYAAQLFSWEIRLRGERAAKPFLQGKNVPAPEVENGHGFIWGNPDWINFGRDNTFPIILREPMPGVRIPCQDTGRQIEAAADHWDTLVGLPGGGSVCLICWKPAVFSFTDKDRTQSFKVTESLGMNPWPIHSVKIHRLRFFCLLLRGSTLMCQFGDAH